MNRTFELRNSVVEVKLYLAGRTYNEYDVHLHSGPWPCDWDLFLMCDGGTPGLNAKLVASQGIIAEVVSETHKIVRLIK